MYVHTLVVDDALENDAANSALTLVAGGALGSPSTPASGSVCTPPSAPSTLVGKDLSDFATEFARFLRLTGQTKAIGRVKCDLLMSCCRTKFLIKQVGQIIHRARSFAKVLIELERQYPSYEMDLSLREEILNISALEREAGANINSYRPGGQHQRGGGRAGPAVRKNTHGHANNVKLMSTFFYFECTDADGIPIHAHNCTDSAQCLLQ